jgi:hypothetical protein
MLSAHTPVTPEAEFIQTVSSVKTHPLAFQHSDDDDSSSDDVLHPTPRRSTNRSIARSITKLVAPMGAADLFSSSSQDVDTAGDTGALFNFLPLSQPITLRLSQRDSDAHSSFQPPPRREPVPILNPQPFSIQGPIIVPGDGKAESAGSKRHNLMLCDNYRTILASADCLYMSNIGDHSNIALMQHAFQSVTYDFNHDVKERAVVVHSGLLLDPKWIDHAFWVAAHFFTPARFPDFTTRADLVRSFFIVSMRLFWIDGGQSHRLTPTPNFKPATGIITPDGGGAAAAPGGGDASKRRIYSKIGFLPTTMPAATRFSIGAEAVYWPSDVRIQDLWDHDICALFALVPELVTAIVMCPDQHTNAAPFRRLLYASTYWPAVRVGNEVCVLIDECVRKIYATQLLTYDETKFEVKLLTTPYWPVVAAAAKPPRRTAAAKASSFPYAFNRCRRTDGSEFWLTPFVRWNETETRSAFPTKLNGEIANQTPAQKTKIEDARDPASLAEMYPLLYTSSARRVLVLARHSNTIKIDAVGERMKHKGIAVDGFVRSAASSSSQM